MYQLNSTENLRNVSSLLLWWPFRRQDVKKLLSVNALGSFFMAITINFRNYV